MTRSDKKLIANIIKIEPFLYGLQDKIEKEQERVVADYFTPAKKIVQKLIELDNRRIDLCNLKVLYGAIRRELGENFPVFELCATTGTECSFYDRAASALALTGYDLVRVRSEFSYLFDALDGKKSKKKKPGAAGAFPGITVRRYIVD